MQFYCVFGMTLVKLAKLRVAAVKFVRLHVIIVGNYEAKLAPF